MFFVDDVPATPLVWQVCFAKRTREHFIDRFLAPGFRHVFLLGYLPDHRLWLWFDPRARRSEISIVSPQLAGRLLTLAVDEGAVLSFVPPPPERLRLLDRFGFWCVPAVCRVLGLRCVAATPKQLHDFLRKSGAKPLIEESHEPVRRAPDTPGRPRG